MYPRRSMLSTIVVLILAVATLTQAAEVVLVTADKFVPYVEPNTRAFIRDVGHLTLSGTGAGIYFIATVTLPVGKTITSLKYYHRGVAGQASSSQCDLIRVRMGDPTEVLATGSVAASTLGSVIIREDTTVQSPVVSAFHQYMISVYVDNQNTSFLGAKVYLQ